MNDKQVRQELEARLCPELCPICDSTREVLSAEPDAVSILRWVTDMAEGYGKERVKWALRYAYDRALLCDTKMDMAISLKDLIEDKFHIRLTDEKPGWEYVEPD